MRSRWTFVFALCVLAGAVSLAQELPPPPETTFKALHLFNLAPTDTEEKVLAVLADLNAVTAKAGHPEIRYRLWKVSGPQQGGHAYLFESTWPGRAVYEKIHDHPDFQAAVDKHPGAREMLKDEVYNRLVEVPPAQ